MTSLLGGPAPASLLPAPLERATAVLACPHCRGRLRPEDRSLICPLGHRFDVARHGGVRLERGRRRHPGDDREMIDGAAGLLRGGRASAP